MNPIESAENDLDTDTEQGRFSEILQNHHFLRLWSGQILAQLADKVFFVFLVVLLTLNGKASNSAISALTLVFTIPAVIFGSIAGVFVDRWDKKSILIVSNLLRASFILMLPIFDNSGWGIYLVAFLVSTVTQFFAPAELSMIPALVQKRNLLAANSLFTTTMIGSIIVGFALGEPITSFSGAKMSHLSVAAMYVISAACIFFVIHVRPTTQHHSPKEFWAEFKDGLKFVASQQPIMVAMVRLILLFSTFAALSVLVIGYVQNVLEIDAKYFGYILATAGVGMALGAGIVARWGARIGKQRLMGIGFIGMGLFIALLAQVHKVETALVLAALMGTFASLIAVPLQTLIQELVPESMRGKVFGMQNMLVNTASTLPMALAGVAADLWGVKTILIGLGVLVASGALLHPRKAAA